MPTLTGTPRADYLEPDGTGPDGQPLPTESWLIRGRGGDDEVYSLSGDDRIYGDDGVDLTQGKRTSRPPIPEATKRTIAELHGRGVSIKQIAKRLGIAYGTAWNYIKGTKGTATMP